MSPSSANPTEMIREYYGHLADPEDLLEERLELHKDQHGSLALVLAAEDPVGIAEHLAASVYLAYGTAARYGIDLDAALAEYHRANMATFKDRHGLVEAQRASRSMIPSPDMRAAAADVEEVELP